MSRLEVTEKIVAAKVTRGLDLPLLVNIQMSGKFLPYKTY